MSLTDRDAMITSHSVMPIEGRGTAKRLGGYNIFHTLGTGTFSKVKFGVTIDTNEPVAIKILDKDKIQELNMGAQIKREISIMKMINNHINVVSIKEVFATQTKLFIVMEYVHGKELFELIYLEGGMNERTSSYYMNQIVEGLLHCHQIGICHRDLKPENILINSNGMVKITDFGLSNLYVGNDSKCNNGSREKLLHTTCGTPNYVAPEILSGQGYNGFLADVWSIGIIMYTLLAGNVPFNEPSVSALFDRVRKGNIKYPEYFSFSAINLLTSILVVDPSMRCELLYVKKHDWMKNMYNEHESLKCYRDDTISVAHPISQTNANTHVTSDAADVTNSPANLSIFTTGLSNNTEYLMDMSK